MYLQHKCVDTEGNEDIFTTLNLNKTSSDQSAETIIEARKSIQTVSSIERDGYIILI
jgi:hypothetical protein